MKIEFVHLLSKECDNQKKKCKDENFWFFCFVFGKNERMLKFSWHMFKWQKTKEKRVRWSIRFNCSCIHAFWLNFFSLFLFSILFVFFFFYFCVHQSHKSKSILCFCFRKKEKSFIWTAIFRDSSYDLHSHSVYIFAKKMTLIEMENRKGRMNEQVNCCQSSTLRYKK